MVYEGKEKYIFVSYSHKDTARVLPIIEALQKKGFRVWYDGGIEAGTEWPEYVAEHLVGSEVVLVFLSQNALGSQNCTREINFAVAKRKNMLVIHLEEVTMTLGMEMQLGSLQAIFYYRFSAEADFLTALCAAKVLAPCKGISGAVPTPIPAPTPAPQPTEAYTDGLTYTERVDGGVEVSVGSFKGDTLVIPAISPDGKPVIAVAAKGFQSVYTLKRLTVSEGVRVIGAYAFSGCGLESVSLPESLTAIGENAFRSCTKLKRARIPSKITRLESTFYLCSSLESCELPQGLREMAGLTFADCRSLKSILLPDSLEKMGYGEFIRCSVLNTAFLPKSIKRVGGGIFKECRRLMAVHCEAESEPSGFNVDWLTDSHAEAIWGSTYEKSLEVRPAIEETDGMGLHYLIENNGTATVFRGSFSGEELVIPAYTPEGRPVARVGAKGFELCRNLKKLTLSYGIREIGNEAFSYCGLESVALPDSLEKLGDNAFRSCKRLKRVAIPPRVRVLNSTFYFCSALESCELTQGIRELGGLTFGDCTALKDITLPDGIEKLGYAAFLRTALSEIVIPKSVVTVTSSLFKECPNLKTVYCEATARPSGWSEAWLACDGAQVIWGYQK